MAVPCSRLHMYESFGQPISDPDMAAFCHVFLTGRGTRPYSIFLLSKCPAVQAAMGRPIVLC
ncbi:hypothetical protein CBFG_02999 [Clostridiales bacterium 1_7_47FAA]|nr:hypothetical protein CBFG_02999 [Clostridiales bacterium 1_7_47FAA]